MSLSNDIWEIPAQTTDIEGLDAQGRPDPAYAQAIGLVAARGGLRAASTLLEAVVAILLAVPGAIAGTNLVLLAAADPEKLPARADLVWLLLPLLVSYVLVFVFTLVQLILHGLKGVTLGKAAFGIRTVNVRTLEKPGFWRGAVVRYLILAASFLVPLVGPLLVIALSPLFDAERRGRGWPDRVAATWMVDVRRGLNPYDGKRMRIARKQITTPVHEAAPVLPSLATPVDRDAPAVYVPTGRFSGGVVGAHRAAAPAAAASPPVPGGLAGAPSAEAVASVPASGAAAPASLVSGVPSLATPPAATRTAPAAPVAPAAPSPAAGAVPPRTASPATPAVPPAMPAVAAPGMPAAPAAPAGPAAPPASAMPAAPVAPAAGFAPPAAPAAAWQPPSIAPAEAPVSDPAPDVRAGTPVAAVSSGASATGAAVLPASAASGVSAPGPARPGAPRAVLLIDDGQRIEVRAATLLGRAPATGPGDGAADGAGAAEVQLVRVPDETRSVSKTHLAILLSRRGVVAVDRGSTNGSSIVRDGADQPLTPGHPAELRAGDVLRFGDRSLRVEQA